ncbi:EamA family transporter [Pelagibius sp. Alg239-R121]|uniref:EamA family transporter n=1 Tax=Pelagibius sp. Alg239-R121 TaxID=2993448 RepID=UPI0024A75BED|nr:EamA family transporter [Pelagibius sp. Alg239-R121]
MSAMILLAMVTVLYAGYNLFVKLSGEQVPAEASTTIVATICIQITALMTSFLFAGYLLMRGEQTFVLTSGSYVWAAIAGLCIGGAEIGYLYLFGGIGLSKPMAASIAIPTIVSGTILISLVFSYLVLKEAISLFQIFGGVLIVAGIVLLFIKGRGTVPH